MQTSFAYERWVRERVTEYLPIDKAVPGCLSPISANLVINFNLDFFIHLFESLFQIISSVFLGHPIIKLWSKGMVLNFLLKLLNLKSDFTLTQGYLNPNLNNPALDDKFAKLHTQMAVT